MAWCWEWKAEKWQDIGLFGGGWSLELIGGLLEPILRCMGVF